jgi:erythromycin esterase
MSPSPPSTTLTPLAELASHLEPIRTAHEVDEHVQRARGSHPGRPFAEHARAALALVLDLPDEAAAARTRLIAEFHERNVAGRADYAGDAGGWAGTVIGRQRRTGHRVALWDGIAHADSLPDAFDMLVHLHDVSPVHRLTA